jgi:hypothetical protein
MPAADPHRHEQEEYSFIELTTRLAEGTLTRGRALKLAAFTHHKRSQCACGEQHRTRCQRNGDRLRHHCLGTGARPRQVRRQ